MTTDEFTFSQFSSNAFYQTQNARLVDMVGVAAGQRIVDLACGTGAVTKLIIQRMKGARDSAVIAIDQSAIALKQAMDELNDARSSAVQFVQSRVEQLSDSVKDSVDTVFFCNAIHYVPDKGAVLGDISRALKPGGRLAFNTSFFEGAHPEETLLFYRKWMLKAARSLRKEYGLSPVRDSKVQSRQQLTAEEYAVLVETHGFRVERQEIDTVNVPIEGWLDISSFKDFIEGVMPGVPLDKASAALRTGVKDTFAEMKVSYIPRNWLDVVAVRV